MCYSLIIRVTVQPAATTAAPMFPMAKPPCKYSCGDVKIPYPFGDSHACYLNEFNLKCHYMLLACCVAVLLQFQFSTCCIAAVSTALCSGLLAAENKVFAAAVVAAAIGRLVLLLPFLIF